MKHPSIKLLQIVHVEPTKVYPDSQPWQVLLPEQSEHPVGQSTQAPPPDKYPVIQLVQAELVQVEQLPEQSVHVPEPSM